MNISLVKRIPGKVSKLVVQENAEERDVVSDENEALTIVELDAKIQNAIPKVNRMHDFETLKMILSEWRNCFRKLGKITSRISCIGSSFRVPNFNLGSISELINGEKISKVLNSEQKSCVIKVFDSFFSNNNKVCSLLCADMGWGKTRTIAIVFLILQANDVIKQIIIGSKTRILFQWVSEIDSILETMDVPKSFEYVHFYSIIENKKKNKRSSYVKSLFERGGICLTTFEGFKNFNVFEEYTKEQCDKCLLIIDESHYLKSKKSTFMKDF